MKTHLPVALRKALLAALVAVSSLAYNTACAVDLTSNDDNTTLNSDNAVDGVITINITSNGDDPLESLKVDYTGGSVKVNDTESILLNAVINVGENLTFGSDAGKATLLQIRGMGDTKLIVGGNMNVYQTLTLGPGVDQNDGNTATGTSTVEVKGSISFYGDTTSIQGGNTPDSTNVTAGGNIIFDNKKGTTIANEANVESEKGDVTITNQINQTDLSHTSIHGDVSAEQGSIQVQADNITVSQLTGNTATLKAKSRIQLEATDTSMVALGDFKADDVSSKGKNVSVFFSKMAGNITVDIGGTEMTWLNSSEVTESGQVTIGRKTGSTYVEVSEISASNNVNVLGSTVEVVENKGIVTTGDKISILASAGKASVADGYVRAMNGSVQVAGTQGTAVSGVDVDGKAVEIGDSQSKTVLGKNGDVSTTVVANTGDLNVIGSTVTVQDKTEATAVTGSVTLTGGTQNAVMDSTVKAGTDVKLTGDQNTLNNVVTDATVSAGQDVGLEGKYNAITSASTVKSGQNVVMDAGENNVVTAASTVAATCNVDMTAGEGNYITTADVAVKAGQDVGLTAETANTISASTVTAAKGSLSLHNEADATTGVVNTITSGAKATAGTDVNLKGDKNNILDSSSATAVTGSVTLTGGTQNAVMDSKVKAGTDVTLTGDGSSLDNVVVDSSIAAGNDANMKGRNNKLANSSSVKSVRDVTLTAETANTIHASTVTAKEGTLALRNAADAASGVVNTLAAGSMAAGGLDVTMKGDKNNILDNSSATAVTGSVKLTGGTQNAVIDSKVKAGEDVVLAGGKDSLKNVVSGATVSAGGDVGMTGKDNTITAASTVKAGDDVVMDSGENNVISGQAKVTALESVLMDADGKNYISDAETQVYAVEMVKAAGADNVVNNEARLIGMQGAELVAETDNTITAGGQVLAMNDSASVSLTAGADNLISGAASKVYAGKDVKLQAESENMVYSATVAARTGDVSMGNAAGSTDIVVNTITGAAKVSATGNVTLTGEKNAIVAGSQVLGGQNVQLTGGSQNAVANATVTSSRGSISMSGADKEVKNVVTSETAATSLAAYKDVTLTGDNIITSADKSGPQTSIAAQNGSITLNEKNYIRNASMEARDIIVTTGAGKSTYIADSSLKGDTVSIAGDTRENLAVVTGEDMSIESFGEDSGAGITLNNVSVQDIGKGNLIARNNGHIVIENRVDVFQGSLTIESGPSGSISAGRIEVEGSNVLNMKADSRLDGGLSGDGSINKSGGDELRLDRDHRGFSGTIYANGATGGREGSVVDADNAGSWIQVTDAGVGEDARMVLKNTDLVIETGKTQIGSLDTTQDAGANNTATGGTLGADASYTADGNNREDFKIIGSVVEVKKGVSGDVVHAANLTLSDATLLKLDAEVDAGGNASSDIIAASGTVDVAARAGLNSTSTAAAPSTARVYINHTNMAAAAQAAEGTRTTIMSGTMAGDINADVLYDVEKSANGTYQRRLQDRNVHLENKGDRVDLVFSKNYRSAAKDASMQTVADAIRQYSDAFHHTEGTLAAGGSQMEKLVDAFDYTRSEGAAQRGLQSIAGFGNVIPQLMLFDSSRHHLNNLRKQMDMPVCPRTWKGAPNRRSNAWVTYTGAHDSLNGDAHLGDYTRSAHGAMLGVDTSVNCKTRVGLSLGYESSSGEADGSKVDADTFFVDAYATAYTGHIKHRVSMGIATSSFDSRRAVEVEAGYHSFHGSSRADTDALTLNFGYEISADHRLNERSWLTRYAALNLSWHNLDDMREEGLDGVGLVTEFDKEWQADVALGLAYNREFAAVKYEAPAVFYANAAVHFELLADRAEATNRFNGAESGWKIESMEREQLYFELGAGVMVPLSPAWTATAGAAVEIGSDRTSFSGNVGVRYSF